MKRIASTVAALALAATAVVGSAAQAQAADVDVVTFNPTKSNTNGLGTVITVSYTDTFACYKNLRHRAQELDGKLVVWMEATRHDGMCIQVLSTHTFRVFVRPGVQVVSLAEAKMPLVEA